jgi:ATP-dependent RNA helicase SUPV3L1/SUV3
MQITTSRSRLVAVLGPTNTGKTHLAMERMLGHESGMIGFPLRLLARENYDRAVRIKGRTRVALITGEEKIVPPQARYFMCTVESMPVDRQVAFLGIDEIQMCADPDRGHVFTDRTLHARGSEETMFMGADTIRPLLTKLVPDIEFVSRPRFSTLTYTGQRKVTRLPPKSAVVAFSAADVYAIADLVRRQRGGAAVVLGALSPRTRNAQVDMYQAGEVDYLVATDAVGMGLNMNVDHVAFAAMRKFDGRQLRGLMPAELAQIAGRAGRHMNDGTFGTTADIAPLDPDTVEAIESHRFERLRGLFWRNAELRFTSLDALRASLTQASDDPVLIKAREADDELALVTLAKDPEIARIARDPDTVRLLWDVCRIPDFRKIMSDAHTRLLGQIYGHLAGPEGRLPTDWVGAQVARIDRTDGDIETLVQRIANVRTWTYVSFQGDWLGDAGHWQERTRTIEDSLSDALHQRLTQRFVDRRTSVLVKRMKDGTGMSAAVDADGKVMVEGHFVGHLEGLCFAADKAAPGFAAKAVGNAAQRALGSEITTRLQRLEDDPDEAFALTADGGVLWRGDAVGRLAAGADILSPSVAPLASDLLEGSQMKRLHRRLSAFVEGWMAARLAPLMAARRAPLQGLARGLVFELGEGLGSLPRRRVAKHLKALGRDERKSLRSLGVRIGRESVFMPELLKPAAVETRALLWTLKADLDTVPETPAPGRVSVPLDTATPDGFYEAVGYRPLGPRAIRVDMVERVAAKAWSLSRNGPFAAGPELLSLVACTSEEMARVLKMLGYRAGGDGDAVRFSPEPRRGKGPGGPGKRSRKTADEDMNSPFAKLRELAPLR